MDGLPVIDAHTHFMPLGIPDMAEMTGDGRWPSLVVGDGDRGHIMRGVTRFRSVASPLWDGPARIAAMDGSGIDVHVLSPVPITFVYWADAALAAEFVRIQNDLLAEAAAASNGRFIAMGGVPLQDVDSAIAELGRATELGLIGVEIGTRVGMAELDDMTLRPFFAAAEAARMPLFIHPSDGAGAIRRTGQPYEFGIGMLTDTALAATALLLGGVLTDFPDLQISLAHGCGTLPWVYPRVMRMAHATGEVPSGSLDDLLRLLWVDSLVFDERHLPLLFQRFGSDHVMLGSDTPFLSDEWGRPDDMVRSAVELGLCTQAEADGVMRTNALRFFGLAGEAN